MNERQIEALKYGNNGGCGPTLIALLMLVAMMLAAGCKSAKYVPVETIIRDTITTTRIVYQRDSIDRRQQERDTSWVSIYYADSARLASLGISLREMTGAYVVERNRVQQLTDIINRLSDSSKQSDSVAAKTERVEVPLPVERNLSRWEQFCIDYGKVMLGASAMLAVGVMLAVRRYVRKQIYT